MTSAPPKPSSSLGPYGEDFYREQMDGSARSAGHYVGYLSGLFQPRRVADVGCGRGTWLKAFKDAGSECQGFDGPWNSQSQLVDPAIGFTPVDLNQPLPAPAERYDLAVSLEVAEHLQPASAPTFIDSLVRLADAVMFAGAYTGQGGVHHVNEQQPTYWARLFQDRGYQPYDLFRPVFWGHPEVQFWYQQNTFLYVKLGATLNDILARAGHRPLGNLAFMDCVHPTMYGEKLLQLGTGATLRRMAARVVPEPLMPMAQKISDALRK